MPLRIWSPQMPNGVRQEYSQESRFLQMKALFPLLITGTLVVAGCIVRANPEWVAPYVGSMMGKLCGWETDDNPWTNPNYYADYHNFDHKADFRHMRSGMQSQPTPRVPLAPTSNPFTQ